MPVMNILLTGNFWTISERVVFAVVASREPAGHSTNQGLQSEHRHHVETEIDVFKPQPGLTLDRQVKKAICYRPTRLTEAVRTDLVWYSEA